MKKPKIRLPRRSAAGEKPKTKKRGAAPPESEDKTLEAIQKAYALERQQQNREKRKKTEEQELNLLFWRRTRAAPNAKAPVTSRSRAYYRFSRRYRPADAAGVRDNTLRPKTASRTVLTALLLLGVFCLSFVMTKTGMLISAETPAATEAPEPPAAEETPMRFLRIPTGLYAAGDAASIAEALKARGCNTAVIEIKDEAGNVNLATPDFAAASENDVDPTQTLAALHEAGFDVCAYISCFLDPAAAEWETDMAVLKGTDGGGVWLDDSGAGWLNPYAERARAYISQIAAAAAEAGFDRILLDHVCFSPDVGAAPAYYPGENAGGARNAALTAFVQQAVKAAGDAPVIVMTDYTAFDPLAAADLPAYGGSMLNTPAALMAVDARLSRQKKNRTVGTEHFADPADLPFVFTLAAGDAAAKGLAEALGTSDGLICVEDGDTLDETLRAALLTRLTGYLIW